MPFAFVPVVEHLPTPVHLLELPDGTLLVACLGGELMRVDPEAGTVLGEAPMETVSGGEQGLVSVLLDPLFGDGQHDWLYTWRTTAAEEENSLSRWHLTLDPLRIEDERVLLTAVKDVPGHHEHNGGGMVFWGGAGGRPLLHLTVGDGGIYDGEQSGQDGGDFLGSVLVLDVDPDTGAVSPGDPGPWEEPLVAAIGLRNPWRMVDCGAVLCIAEVGWRSFEEINSYAAPGMNFGWPEQEGPGDGTYDEPAFSYPHGSEAQRAEDPEAGARDGGDSVMVGVRVSDRPFSGRLAGHLLFGEVYQGWIRAVPVDEGGGFGQDFHVAHQSTLTAMIETSDGRIYGTDMTGTLRRMVEHDEVPNVGEPGDALSGTTFPEGGIVYDVRHPAWTNGADEARWLQLPEGATIDTSDPDAWEFPVGTRAWQTLSDGGTAVETRLLEKTEEGWASGVYVWQGDEAFLTNGAPVVVSTSLGEHSVPGRSDCDTCHSGAHDRLLGVEAFQLGDEGLDVLRPYLSDPPADAPEVDGDAVTQAARGYLHGNCAYCHHPGSVAGLAMDLRYSTPEASMFVVYVPSLRLDPGEPIVVPGDPDGSLLVRAMEEVQMPPLQAFVPDEAGIAVVSAWIEGL